MINIIEVSKYVCDKYLKINNSYIDEMRLHNLLYLIQREYFVKNNEFLFNEDFEVYEYGFICNKIKQIVYDDIYLDLDISTIIDEVFDRYSNKSIHNLSNLVCKEYSWEITNELENKIVNKEYIKVDAERIRKRQEYLKNKKQNHYIPYNDNYEDDNIDLESASTALQEIIKHLNQLKMPGEDNENI